MERGHFGLQLRTWYRLPDDENNEDNPDLIRYMGYGELCGTLYQEKHRFAVMLRNNFRRENFGAVQVDWSIPLSLVNKIFGDSFSSLTSTSTAMEKACSTITKASTASAPALCWRSGTDEDRAIGITLTGSERIFYGAGFSRHLTCMESK